MKNFTLAKYYHRLGAFFLDLFLVSLLYGSVESLINLDIKTIFNRFFVTTGNSWIDFSVLTASLIIFLVIVPQFNKGMTIGQKVVGIKMINDRYEETNWKIFLYRLLIIYPLTIIFLGLPLIINIYLIGFRKDRKTIQDLIMKTSVIWIR